MKWTEEQDLYVLANAHLGAERVRRGMLAEFGVLRSAEAVVRHGNRIGASFELWDECPRCGAKVRSLNLLTGLCPSCHWHHLADEKARIRAELEKANDREAKRRYDREQKGARRAYEKSVRLSAKMSECLVS